MKHLKLGAKFLLGGILLLVIPIGLIGIITVVESTRSISELEWNHLSIIAKGLASTLGIGVNEQLITVKNIASSNSIILASEKNFREGEKNSRSEIALAESELIRIKDNEGDRCSSVNLIDMKGIFYASSNRKANVGINVSDRDYFKTAIRGIPNVGSVVVSKASGRIVLSTASPVYGSAGKEITGIAMIAMEIKYLTDIIDAVKIGKTGYATISQKNGITIAHPIKENILKENISEVAGMEAAARMVDRGESGSVEYRRFGVAKMAGIANVPLTGWSVFVTIERADLYSSATTIRNLIIGIGAISLAVASLLLFLFSRNLTAPLIKIVGAAEGIAAGNLSVELAFASRHDEVGSLSRAFVLMANSLKGVALVAEKIASGDLTVEVTPLSEKDTLGNAFSAMVAKLRSHLNGISEGFAVLTSAASEILAATTQVVSGTAETATAISQTTATIEEVRQAARLSSEKAKNVANNAQQVTQVSQSGQAAVEDTATVILRIRDQMESIAQTIVRLSEQSQSIGGIIASVTDLADQSNLLAVNASIEAARAGEQGKGFTVIALEIKSLAEQSKQATAQVRGILSEVQKATGAAVMATEQGTKAVEAGVKQSAQAGEAIRILAESSTEAMQAATQIVASSQQQVVGMDQVGIAMANICQAGAQTAASMRQAETAAQNLHELGQRLKGLVEQYET
jgi:methyl-accepting chemotaxis protein